VGISQRIHTPHSAISCGVVFLKTDDTEDDTRLLGVHCYPGEKALEGKCKLYVDGYRYLEFSHGYGSSLMFIKCVNHVMNKILMVFIVIDVLKCTL
jgi:hypothetical protein